MLVKGVNQVLHPQSQNLADHIQVRALVHQLQAARSGHFLHQASALPKCLYLQVPHVAAGLRATHAAALRVAAVATVAAVLVLQAAAFPKSEALRPLQSAAVRVKKASYLRVLNHLPASSFHQAPNHAVLSRLPL